MNLTNDLQQIQKYNDDLNYCNFQTKGKSLQSQC